MVVPLDTLVVLGLASNKKRNNSTYLSLVFLQVNKFMITHAYCLRSSLLEKDTKISVYLFMRMILMSNK
jgi:hypothetical protein